MKILWIVNTIFPYPAKKLDLTPTVFGGWLISLTEGLQQRKEIKELAIATVYNGEKLIKYRDNNIIYYLLPNKNINKYDYNLEKIWPQVTNEFKPDVVHIHGTEYPHATAFLRSCPNETCCVSIQGLVSVCGKKENYNAGLNWFDCIRNITIRDILKNDLLLYQYKKFMKRGTYEKEILNKCDIIIGRTAWDKAHAYEITRQNKYDSCNESLRKKFYEGNWEINKIDRHSIFVSQASYPLKGFHKVIEAAKILVEKYPDLKIRVAGPDITRNKGNIKEKLKISGYGNFLKKLIKENNLEKHVEFIGLLNAEEMCEVLLNSHVYLQASSIENSSNSLGEAMLLGMPCVASYVGGTSDMLLDKKEGFLYPFNESSMIAKYVSDIFENDDLAIELGRNAQKHAKITHSIENNVNKIIEIYTKIKK